MELVPPGSFSFVCGTVESATRSRKNSVALIVPISGLVDHLEIGELKLHLSKFEVRVPRQRFDFNNESVVLVCEFGG